MNQFSKLSLCLFAVVALGFAQTPPTQTTLAAAMTRGTDTINLASSTSVSAASGTNVVTGGYVDREYMTFTANVNAAGTGNVWTVKRGVGGVQSAHVSGAAVWIAPPGLFDLGPTNRTGSCTRTSLQYAPIINVRSGVVSDCLGGLWLNGAGGSGITTASRFHVYSPEPGGTIYTSLNTNGTAVGATTLYCSEVFLPANKLLTGIGVLNGTTVTANARYVILYDSAGIPLANSALAGAASVTASIYENFAFTTKFFATGPAQYFGCIQDNAVGSTTVRMAITQVNDNILTKGQTGATFGTVPALTVPSTFTTAVGPYLYLY
jgi:hypothetical protein